MFIAEIVLYQGQDVHLENPSFRTPSEGRLESCFMDPEEIRARVARRIRDLAARRKLTLNDLAEHAGVSRSHLHAVLAGERAATTDVLTKIATALRVDPHEILRPPRKSRGTT